MEKMPGSCEKRILASYNEVKAHNHRQSVDHRKKTGFEWRYRPRLAPVADRKRSTVIGQ